MMRFRDMLLSVHSKLRPSRCALAWGRGAGE
jgi:hypothetical protein